MDDAGLLCCLRVFERKEKTCLEKTKQKGITFHSFPSDKQRRQSWTIALRREGFEPKDSTVHCAAVIFGLKILTKVDRLCVSGKELTPSILNFLIIFQRGRPALFDQSISDHQYALDPVKAKEKLAVSQENVEKLRQDLRNAKDRERRQKKTVGSFVGGFKRTRC
ncbi:hypothetical protein UPYG_G00342440 [Umbra pygmaea]|uniref:THAP-type domain-containing protein n=1 Tax=Umbra pygmaea TaxID=75934 RepID=A0ABD0VY87_UMBPY